MLDFFKRKHDNADDDFGPNEDSELKAFIPRSDREASYKEASVTFPTGYVLRGVVMDYSRTGVRLRFQNYEHFPENVWLKVHALKLSCQAEVAWQDNVDVGLQFVRRS